MDSATDNHHIVKGPAREIEHFRDETASPRPWRLELRPVVESSVAGASPPPRPPATPPVRGGRAD